MSVLFNQTNVAPGTSFISTIGGGGGGSNFPSGFTTGTAGAGGFVVGTSTLVSEYATTASNVVWSPLSFTIRPDEALKGGTVQAIFNFDAVDSGANVACVVGATSNTAFIGSQWLGYITAPLSVYGATVSLVSDNETFFYMDGKEGGIGTISTGVQMLSADNVFNTITEPSKVYTADMTALWSTLAAVYPDCFPPAKIDSVMVE